jgi:ribosome-associated protein
MTELLQVTDYFVITNGTNRRQVQAIADEIKKQILERGHRTPTYEGYVEGRWVLMDCGDVIVHIFDSSARDYYGLEHLWADAPRVRWQKVVRRKTPGAKKTSKKDGSR